MSNFLDRLFNQHKFVRRASMFWAWWIITVVLMRVTDPDIITQVTPAGATIVTATIGILATVIGLYTRSRGAEDLQAENQDAAIPLGSSDDKSRGAIDEHYPTERRTVYPGLD